MNGSALPSEPRTEHPLDIHLPRFHLPARVDVELLAGMAVLRDFRRVNRRLHTVSRPLRQAASRTPAQGGPAVRTGTVAEDHRLARDSSVLRVHRLAGARPPLSPLA